MPIPSLPYPSPPPQHKVRGSLFVSLQFVCFIPQTVASETKNSPPARFVLSLFLSLALLARRGREGEGEGGRRAGTQTPHQGFVSCRPDLSSPLLPAIPSDSLFAASSATSSLLLVWSSLIFFCFLRFLALGCQRYSKTLRPLTNPAYPKSFQFFSTVYSFSSFSSFRCPHLPSLSSKCAPSKTSSSR